MAVVSLTISMVLSYILIGVSITEIESQDVYEGLKKDEETMSQIFFLVSHSPHIFLVQWTEWTVV